MQYLLFGHYFTLILQHWGAGAALGGRFDSAWRLDFCEAVKLAIGMVKKSTNKNGPVVPVRHLEEQCLGCSCLHAKAQRVHKFLTFLFMKRFEENFSIGSFNTLVTYDKALLF